MTTIYERKKNGNEKNLSLWVSPHVSSCIVLTAEEEKKFHSNNNNRYKIFIFVINKTNDN